MTSFISYIFEGYGLEDDESKPGQKAFTFKVGDSTVIAALNDALPGMKVGETRRLAILVSSTLTF
jgi:FKBP-type peptidyl-prolyl cis-trans isomerase